MRAPSEERIAKLETQKQYMSRGMIAGWDIEA